MHLTWMQITMGLHACVRNHAYLRSMLTQCLRDFFEMKGWL